MGAGRACKRARLKERGPSCRAGPIRPNFPSFSSHVWAGAAFGAVVSGKRIKVCTCSTPPSISAPDGPS